MSVICPYCGHAMNVKGVRPGRFTPKCAKCAKTFSLVVTADAEPQFHTAKLDAAAPKPAAKPAFDPDATAPSEAEMPAVKVAAGKPAVEATMADADGPDDDANFSVAASVVKAVVKTPAKAKPAPAEDVDTTAALDMTAAPARKRVDLDRTEAEGESDAGEEKRPPADDRMPDVLGGYAIVKELGRGGMGAVYLARQISLDRPVALKVMNAQWASNPNFLVRFTREAYAAAQLVHHNIVQVYDIGDEQGINFFSMEYVEGRSLGDLVKKEGKLEPEVVAGYMAQAARGLKFAHDRGMIHRDIKPDNLMLNTQGVVKVADLGLVRTPGMTDEKPLADELGDAPAPAPAGPNKSGVGRSLASLSGVTLAGQAMGTPSYMAPEQSLDATSVDHRADIYSLGCTLYVMTTGRPVFTGDSALEVMTKHAMEPVVPPARIDKSVPKALSDVTVKMLAKKPEDRYQSMDEVITALEDFLGLHGAKEQAVGEQHIRTLEAGVKAFRDAPAAALRGWLLLGFFGGCAALTVLLVLIGFWKYAGVLVGLGLLTGVSYFLVSGSAERTHVFLKARDVLLGTTWAERGKLALGLLLFVAALYLFGQFWFWLLAGLLGVGLALGLHYSLDRRIAKDREKAAAKIESLLKTLRARGLSEDALHEFVAKNAGEHWEQFFEALFGYEAKLAARLQYGNGPKGPRPKYGWWREPLLAWLDGFQKARQAARERKVLQAIELKSLQAQGVNAEDAKAQAAAVADAMVNAAATIKRQSPALPEGIEATVSPEDGQVTHVPTAKPPAKKMPPPRRVNVQDMLEIGVKPDKAPRKTAARSMEQLLQALFGGTVRFVVGSVLFAVGLFWMHSQGLMPSSTNFDDTGVWAKIWKAGTNPAPLQVSFLPEFAIKMASGIAPAIAGAALIFSAIWFSWKIGVMCLSGAAVMVLGPALGVVPEVGPLTPYMLSLAVGGGLMVLGFVFGRDT